MRVSGYPPDNLGWARYVDIALLVAIGSNQYQIRHQPCGAASSCTSVQATAVFVFC